MYQEFYFLCFFNKVLFFGFIFYCKIKPKSVVISEDLKCSLPPGGSRDTPGAELQLKPLTMTAALL